MNIAQLLAYGPRLKSSTPTQEEDAARKSARERTAATLIARSNARYFEVFKQLPDLTGPSTAIASKLGMQTCNVTRQLANMAERENPVVKRVGEIPHVMNGRGTHIWKWIGPVPEEK